MNKTTLQVPIDSVLKDKATKVAQELGFSSLQEAVRVYLKQLSDKKINISIVRDFGTEYLQPVQEMKLQKSKKNAELDIKKGNYISSQNSKEIMDFLND